MQNYYWTSKTMVLGAFLILFFPLALFAQGLMPQDSALKNKQVVLTRLTNGEDRGEVLAIQNDGKIVMAGVANHEHHGDFSVVRYLADGNLDPSFGKGGIVITNLGGDESVYGLVLQNDGRILVAGHTQNGNKKDLAIVRYLADGSCDLAFGKNGVVIDHFGGEEEIHYMVLQNDQKIVVAGFIEQKNDSDFLVVRYDTDGYRDPSFGNGGWFVSDFTMQDRLYGLALQNDDKIVAVGSVFHSKDQDNCAVIRLNPDGSLDESFGDGTFVELPKSEQQDICASVVIKKDGQIVVAGFSNQGKNNTDFSIFQLQPHGQRDINFGDQGLVTTDFFGGFDMAHALAIDQNGGLIVAGQYEQKRGKSGTRFFGFAVTRYDPTGKLDPSFGRDGKDLIDFSGRGLVGANDLAVTYKGQLILAGYADKQFAMVQYSLP